MMAETRCPYCGASEDANGPRLTFECGSGGSCEGSVIRAAPCYLRQLATANAKITELEQAATTLQQLEELLLVADIGIQLEPRFDRCIGVSLSRSKGRFLTLKGEPFKDLPAAVAAAWTERLEEE